VLFRWFHEGVITMFGSRWCSLIAMMMMTTAGALAISARHSQADPPYCTGLCRPGWWQGYQLVNWCTATSYHPDPGLWICNDTDPDTGCLLAPGYDIFESGDGCVSNEEPTNETCTQYEYQALAHVYDTVCDYSQECECLIIIIETNPDTFVTCTTGACPL
jgi:hypothetical protein